MRETIIVIQIGKELQLFGYILMIIYVKGSKDLTTRVLDGLNTFRKVTRYKLDKQKLVDFFEC